jgi:pimeloyl-ACP methyl ester carboxylesterase
MSDLYRDGPARVTVRTDLPIDDRRGPPRSVTDLVRGLEVRADQDDGGGLIDVRILDGPAGRRVIVDITGTSIWNLNPLTRTPQATDVGTNLRSLAGRDSVMQRGVSQALRMAGVGPADPIMLIGHSQGGIVAARLAADLTAGRQYRVTHLLTAGAPIGLAELPDSVSVLSLENRGDPVPQLDGADNPDRPNWLTAGLPADTDPTPSRHSIESYLAGAPELDRCRDPVLDRWRAGAAGFLGADTVRTQVFQVRRAG